MFDFQQMFASMSGPIKFDGKEYKYVKDIGDGYIAVVEVGATLPAPVVVIKDPNYKPVEEEK